ncbi:hypothetical protein CCC_02282 [Paramagnetospirillum magnetotacticum MS-1]|uniref:Uncharacterized protein n=1 Tax=Paramagnetospirillum magnetotacticum MS-1 TaxID=272627 RepID=A0A0C2UBG1_PARME|nr:hypothetical protein [Paramagnetospirillum magnetotacticum]KIL98832.1 hypothetical protein CCC_02282 [Paramagnetospirillum magnetotacticum MS-1]
MLIATDSVQIPVTGAPPRLVRRGQVIEPGEVPADRRRYFVPFVGQEPHELPPPVADFAALEPMIYADREVTS